MKIVLFPCRVRHESLRLPPHCCSAELKFDVQQIVPAQLGPEAGVVGAAQWAREQQQN